MLSQSKQDQHGCLIKVTRSLFLPTRASLKKIIKETNTEHQNCLFCIVNALILIPPQYCYSSINNLTCHATARSSFDSEFQLLFIFGLRTTVHHEAPLQGFRPYLPIMQHTQGPANAFLPRRCVIIGRFHQFSLQKFSHL